MRLDVYLVEKLQKPRSFVQYLIGNNHVLIDGLVISKSSFHVKDSSNCEMNLSEEEIEKLYETYNHGKNPSLAAANIELDIIYEDEHLLVINKQAGLIVHPGNGAKDNTLVNALVYHVGKDNLSDLQQEEHRLGIVHRLDKDTSGLMMVAKTNAAHYSLASQIQERQILKKYIAICHKTITPCSGKIVNYIDRHPKIKEKMYVSDRNSGREAITIYSTLETFQDKKFSLIECQIITGRTHQIRVHLSHKKVPVLGDNLYGNIQMNRMLDVHRQMLHSNELEFIHPITNELMKFKCDQLPKDMTELIANKLNQEA